MPSIGELNYGYDAGGVDAYLEEIKAKVLTEVAAQLEDTSAIESACNENWEGIANENFLANLKTDVAHVKEQYQVLYNVLNGEIQSVHAAMANKDESLIG